MKYIDYLPVLNLGFKKSIIIWCVFLNNVACIFRKILLFEDPCTKTVRQKTFLSGAQVDYCNISRFLTKEQFSHTIKNPHPYPKGYHAMPLEIVLTLEFPEPKLIYRYVYFGG